LTHQDNYVERLSINNMLQNILIF